MDLTKENLTDLKMKQLQKIEQAKAMRAKHIKAADDLQATILKLDGAVQMADHLIEQMAKVGAGDTIESDLTVVPDPEPDTEPDPEPEEGTEEG